MFEKPTVFILGAGASWHYGYPTGEELVRKIRNKCQIATLYFQNSAKYPNNLFPQYVSQKHKAIADRGGAQWLPRRAWDEASYECQQLYERLGNVDPLVIDYFLDQNEPLRDIGRLMIAWVLRDCETEYWKARRNLNRDSGGQPNQDNWCRFIIHRLVVGCDTSDQLRKNKVTFVTFNYDVSLEDHVEKGLRSIQRFGYEDVSEFLSRDRFLHVYGKIREIEGGAFEPLVTAPARESLHLPLPAPQAIKWVNLLNNVYDASKRIRTIDPHDKEDENVLTKARNAVAAAECVYILGFGFDANNCIRLGLDKTLRQPDARTPQDRRKTVLFTNFGDVNRVNKAASKLFFSRTDRFPPGKYVEEPERHYGFYFEKSTRNCYDALALDFDEIEAD
jgi:hypothetical protein